jgi:hypothetical protein
MRAAKYEVSRVAVMSAAKETFRSKLFYFRSKLFYIVGRRAAAELVRQ